MEVHPCHCSLASLGPLYIPMHLFKASCHPQFLKISPGLLCCGPVGWPKIYASSLKLKTLFANYLRMNIYRGLCYPKAVPFFAMSCPCIESSPYLWQWQNLCSNTNMAPSVLCCLCCFAKTNISLQLFALPTLCHLKFTFEQIPSV